MIRITCERIIAVETSDPTELTENKVTQESVDTLWSKTFETFNCQNLGDICQQLLNGEPVFIIRAQDRLAPEIIRQYKTMATTKKVVKSVIERVRKAISEINEWRKNNKERIKLPD